MIEHVREREREREREENARFVSDGTEILLNIHVHVILGLVRTWCR